MRSKVVALALSIALGLFCLGGAFTISGCGAGNAGGVTQPTPPSKTIPTITWGPLAAITYGTALSSAQLDATANTPGTFSYTPALGTVLQAGTQTLSVAFTPTDATDYTTATATVQLVVNSVTKTTPTVTWATPAAITYGTALSSTQLDATASASGTFSYTPALGAVLQAGTQTLSLTFTPTDTTDYTMAIATVQLVVDPAVPTVTWPTPAAITSGTALSATQLNATANVSGTFVYTPASGTVLQAGTQTLSLTFTPTDTVDYMVVTATVQLVVDPAVPTLTSVTPRYVVADDFSFFVPYAFQCAGCQNGDIIHDASGLFPDVTLSLVSGATSFGIQSQWQQGTFMPWAPQFEGKHPGGSYGNQMSTVFFGSASQSTLVASSTGTPFQDEEIGSGSTAAASPSAIAIDDTTGDFVGMTTGVTYSSTDKVNPGIGVSNPTTGTPLCYVPLTNITYLSSVAAKDGYVFATAPNENLLVIASLAGCKENVPIGYQTVSIPGQPWSVAVSNGTLYIFSRDKCADGVPCVTTVNVSSGTVTSTLDLPGIIPVSTIRATDQYEGVYAMVAFNQTPILGVLSMADQTDGTVWLLSTGTLGGPATKIASSTSVEELPYILAPDETSSGSDLLVGYIIFASGEPVTHLGTIELTTGNYTSDVGTCPTGLIGGLVAISGNVFCGGGSTIAPASPQPLPIMLSPSSSILGPPRKHH